MSTTDTSEKDGKIELDSEAATANANEQLGMINEWELHGRLKPLEQSKLMAGEALSETRFAELRCIHRRCVEASNYDPTEDHRGKG